MRRSAKGSTPSPPSLPLASSSTGQDATLSRWRRGFDSPRGYSDTTWSTFITRVERQPGDACRGAQRHTRLRFALVRVRSREVRPGSSFRHSIQTHEAQAWQESNWLSYGRFARFDTGAWDCGRAGARPSFIRSEAAVRIPCPQIARMRHQAANMARYANWHSDQAESLMSVGSTPTRVNPLKSLSRGPTATTPLLQRGNEGSTPSGTTHFDGR